MTDLDDDLRRRWTPSKQQDAEAAESLTRDPRLRQVFTAHLLVNKHQGWWDATVEIQHLPGVFNMVESAVDAAKAAGEQLHAETGKAITGGWTRHSLHRQGRAPTSYDGTEWLTNWAVFEDILINFPEPSWHRPKEQP